MMSFYQVIWYTFTKDIFCCLFQNTESLTWGLGHREEGHGTLQAWYLRPNLLCFRDREKLALDTIGNSSSHNWHSLLWHYKDVQNDLPVGALGSSLGETYKRKENMSPNKSQGWMAVCQGVLGIVFGHKCELSIIYLTANALLTCWRLILAGGLAWGEVFLEGGWAGGFCPPDWLGWGEQEGVVVSLCPVSEVAGGIGCLPWEYKSRIWWQMSEEHKTRYGDHEMLEVSSASLPWKTRLLGLFFLYPNKYFGGEAESTLKCTLSNINAITLQQLTGTSVQTAPTSGETTA